MHEIFSRRVETNSLRCRLNSTLVEEELDDEDGYTPDGFVLDDEDDMESVEDLSNLTGERLLIALRDLQFIATKETQEHWYVWIKNQAGAHFALKSMETDHLVLEFWMDPIPYDILKACPDLNIPLPSVRKQYPESEHREVKLCAPFILRGQKHMVMSRLPEGSDAEKATWIMMKFAPAIDNKEYIKIC